MNDFEKSLKVLREIKRDMHKKNVELKELESKKVSLNEQLEMCQTKISWVKEEIEDLICDYFINVQYVQVHSDIIEVKLEFFDNELNLKDLTNFAMDIGKDFKDIKITPYNDCIFLKINI